MDDGDKIDHRHSELRQTLRVLGPAIMVVGLVLVVIGIGNFFLAFGTMEPPRYFWCAFLGLPLIGVGGMITQYAFLGAIHRFVAGEAAPVAKDTFNYMATGTQAGVRDIATAIKQGFAGEPLSCPACGTSHDIEAKFCENCGQPIASSKTCSQCSAANNPRAKFCDTCGHKFPDVRYE